jgi:hypothetical protein
MLINFVCLCFAPAVLNKPVAFTAILRDNVTVNSKETLKSWIVKSSVGGGFDLNNGCFAVPVSGVYCFILTTRPKSDDLNIRTALYVKLDDADIAYCSAYGKTRGTGHCTVHAKAGQTVKVDGCLSSNCRSGWNTTFTGFLVHPDV